jgi:hypothetical protein
MRANFITGLKICSKCNQEQPIENFYSDVSKKDILNQYCKPCCRQRAVDRKKYHQAYFLEYKRRKLKDNPSYWVDKMKQSRYGLSPNEFKQLKKSQKNRCPGCLRAFPGKKDVVDHCHKTGKVRGILCCNCNWALGQVKDDPSILLRLVDYLKSTKSVNPQQNK